MQKIIRNSIYCHDCDETIESTHRHDFVGCKGKHIWVDGGKDYLRRVGSLNGNWEDTSIVEGEDDQVGV